MDGCNANDDVCRPRACQRCPAAGASCFGGADFQVTVPGSTWELSDSGSGVMSMRVNKCPPGFVLVRTEDPLLDQCVECPRSTYSIVAANFFSRTLTIRDAKDAAQECRACPDGAICRGGKNISPQQGYWIPPQKKPRRAEQNATLDVLLGFRRADDADDDEMDLGVGFRRASVDDETEVRVYRCPPDACLEGGVCAEGREGPVCAICSDGYAMAGTQCLKCHQTPRDSLILVIAIAVFGLLVIWYYTLFLPLRMGPPTAHAGSGSEREQEPPRCSFAQIRKLRERGLWRGQSESAGRCLCV
eukprot:260206-Rhodomonas_salina.1